MNSTQRAKRSHRRYVERIRFLLFKVLGEKCRYCDSTKDLEFDVIIPEGDPKQHHAKMSQRQRCNFYIERLRENNLQVLCTKCNSRKNGSDQQLTFNQ
jgi:5-methylcytosine-specific restriction endonuclease McrA